MFCLPTLLRSSILLSPDVLDWYSIPDRTYRRYVNKAFIPPTPQANVNPHNWPWLDSFIQCFSREKLREGFGSWNENRARYGTFHIRQPSYSHERRLEFVRLVSVQVLGFSVVNLAWLMIHKSYMTVFVYEDRQDMFLGCESFPSHRVGAVVWVIRSLIGEVRAL